MSDFFNKQEKINKELYIQLLTITGSLSNLFANSENPYLYYRAMENIFCKAFNADDKSRNDISVDAAKDKIGIGLKTFLHSNGNTFQKIAEFNKQSYLLRSLKEKELIIKVAEMRNKRLETTQKICNVDTMIYHLVTRGKYSMSIYEEKMSLVDIDNIKIIDTSSENTIHFTDGINDYNFSLSKNTLMKRFKTTEGSAIKRFEIEILDDPFEFLLLKKELSKDIATLKSDRIIDFIILPLYSPRSGIVEPRSGLNMWNALGRARDEDEVYIPVPSWIHDKKPSFFKYRDGSRNTSSFNVKLPNNEMLSMKVTQTNGKALQSNPNSKLGKWLLRDVLELKPLEIVTKEMLDIRGIDSVMLSKVSNDLYYLDFLKVGSFENYKNNFVK